MQQNSQTAYLIIKQGSRWSDVFRLQADIPLIIGRASQNQIVVSDERCSRHHAEIAYSTNGWFVKDLGSRNGTLLNGKLITEGTLLQEGDIVQIAACQMTFAHGLAQAFRSERRWSHEQEASGLGESDAITEGAGDGNADRQQTTSFDEPPIITHRQRTVPWLTDSNWMAERRSDVSHPGLLSQSVSGGDIATELFRLTFDLARESTPDAVAQLGLDRLLKILGATAGGVLRMQRRDKAQADSLPSISLLATREREGKAYHRVNDLLVDTVLREGQAVLARNIQQDSQLINIEASAQRRTSSVLCAPIREGKSVLGILHLYTSDDEKMLGPEQLEIAIAVADTLGLALTNLRGQQKLTQKLRDSQRQIQSLQAQLGQAATLVGQSTASQRMEQQIAKVGPTRATILIRGESGVGKEVVARAIHLCSACKEGPFIALNCAALSPTLLESELFGHEKGAFTGATDRKVGKFELADNGTLMLDEIGEMSMEIQAKFLRILEGKPFERLGGSKPIQVRVRVVAATNRDLEQAVKQGAFRADLYFRLRVIELDIPALRERPEDIMPLANYFLQQFLDEVGHGPTGFSPRAEKAMREYQWPGNIRELKNAIERAVVLASGSLAEPEDLALSHLSMPGKETTRPDSYRERSLEEIEKEHILATLKATDGHKSRTATILGIERSTLDRKLKKFEIETEGET